MLPRAKLKHFILLVITAACFLCVWHLHANRNATTRIFNEAVFISAYLLPEMQGIARVVAASRVQPMPKFNCHFANSNGTFFHRSVATTDRLLAIETNYDGVFIDCPFPKGVIPFYIAVTADGISSKKGLQKMRLNVVPARTPKDASLAACVCPLFGNLSEQHLIAWIEMNRLLGVEHFIFYNYSVSPKLIPLFNHYSKLKLVELIDWKLHPVPVYTRGYWPPKVDGLHYVGQFVANNECLYRVRNNFRYVMYTDLDELLVTSNRSSKLPDLVKRLDDNWTMGFVFRGTYVRNDFQEEKNRKNVIFFRSVRREKRILDKDIAPKLIIKAHIPFKVFIHEIEGRQNLGVRVLEPDEGLLFHFRNPPRYLYNSNDTVRDDRLFRYYDELMRSVNRTLKAIHTQL